MTDQPDEQIQTDIAFVDHGQGKPVLLVHGFPLDHSMWQHQIRDLGTDHRVIAVDLPGFGGSEPMERPVSIRDYADALASLLDALEIDEPVIFCGLSMGGYIGWQFLKYHSAKVAALIACDTRATADDEITARGRRVMAHQIEADGSASIAAGMAAKICGVTTARANPNVIEQVTNVIAATEPYSIAVGQLAMAARPDATDWLAEITVPSLFLVGLEDVITPSVEMKSLADSVLGSQFVEIPDAGHLAPLENPVAVNAAIRSFLASNC